MQIDIFNLVWFAVIYFVAYYIGYQFILRSLKLFKIESIPNNKVRNYLIATFIIGLFFDATINPPIILFLGSISNKFALIFLGSIISSSITFLINFPFFKYYFLLSGKVLWRFTLYISLVYLVLLLVRNGLLV